MATMTQAVVDVHRKFTVAEYAQMGAAGIFTEDDRVELLDGEVYVMSPIGSLHSGLVNRLNVLLAQQVGDTAIVSVQNPVQLDDYSEPQPDVALLSPQADYYTKVRARPDDILLIIEVAESSLDYDRGKKLSRYAAANVTEVWIVNVAEQMVEQYTVPMRGRYTHSVSVLAGGTLTPHALPAVTVGLDQLFV